MRQICLNALMERLVGSPKSMLRAQEFVTFEHTYPVAGLKQRDDGSCNATLTIPPRTSHGHVCVTHTSEEAPSKGSVGVNENSQHILSLTRTMSSQHIDHGNNEDLKAAHLKGTRDCCRPFQNVFALLKQSTEVFVSITTFDNFKHIRKRILPDVVISQRTSSP